MSKLIWIGLHVDATAMSTNTEMLKALHDHLLASQPEGAVHDSTACPLCVEGSDSDSNLGGQMPQMYSQEEVDTAVSSATEELRTRLQELESQVQQTEVGKAVEAAVAEKHQAIQDLQSQLDDAVAARTAAEQVLAESHQFWADAIAAHEEAEVFAARRNDRVQQATSAAVLPADYIEANADRFAAMSDEDWQSRLDEWSVLAKITAKADNSTIPERTSLVASQADPPSTGSALSYIGELRRQRVDPKNLVGGF